MDPWSNGNNAKYWLLALFDSVYKLSFLIRISLKPNQLLSQLQFDFQCCLMVDRMIHKIIETTIELSQNSMRFTSNFIKTFSPLLPLRILSVFITPFHR